MGCLADTGCPFEESCLIPFAVQLIVDRYMLWDCGILSTASIKMFVAANTVLLVVDFNADLGVSDIHFLTYILILD